MPVEERHQKRAQELIDLAIDCVSEADKTANTRAIYACFEVRLRPVIANALAVESRAQREEGK